eukprot:COSAG05_NODE_21717_length_270_cov_0.339181_1_plen_80_part_10
MVAVSLKKYETEDELIPDRELSDIAYMTKQLETSDTDSDSDWTPHEDPDSGSESTDSDYGVLGVFSSRRRHTRFSGVTGV